MFQQNSNQSAEGQTKKGTLSDMKEQQRQKPPGGKTQDWVSRESVPAAALWAILHLGLLNPQTEVLYTARPANFSAKYWFLPYAFRPYVVIISGLFVHDCIE
jgi:hypothetical protein